MELVKDPDAWIRSRPIEDPTALTIPRLTPDEQAQVQNDPAIRQAIERWIEGPQKELLALYKARGGNYEQETESGVFAHLAPVREGGSHSAGMWHSPHTARAEALAPKRAARSPGARNAGQFGRTPFAKTARGTAYGYETDPEAILRHSYRIELPGWELGNFLNTLQTRGIGRPTARDERLTEGVTPFDEESNLPGKVATVEVPLEGYFRGGKPLTLDEFIEAARTGRLPEDIEFGPGTTQGGLVERGAQFADFGGPLIVNGREVRGVRLGMRAPVIDSIYEATPEEVAAGFDPRQPRQLPVGTTVLEGRWSDYVVPEEVARDFHTVVQRQQQHFKTPSLAGRIYRDIMNGLTGLALANPGIAYAHGWRELNDMRRIVTAEDLQARGIDQEAWRMLTASPRGFVEAVDRATNAFATTKATDGRAIDGVDMFYRLARAGGLRVDTIEHLRGRDHGEGINSWLRKNTPLGIPEQQVFGLPDFGKKSLAGLDTRARVAAAKMYLEIKPDATDAELADFANQFGHYSEPLQGWLTYMGRKSKLFPFAGFESGSIPTEVARYLGFTGMDLSHLPREVQQKAMLVTLFKGALGTALITGLANWLITGELFKPGTKPFDIRMLTFDDGRHLDLASYGIDPAMARGGRILPARAMVEGLFHDGSFEDKFAVALDSYGRDVINDVMAWAGPGVHFGFTALTGRDMYITPQGELERKTPEGPTPGSTLGQHALTTALGVFPLARDVKDVVAPFVGAEAGGAWRYNEDPTIAAAERLWNLAAPIRIREGMSDEDAMERHQKIADRQAREWVGREARHAAKKLLPPQDFMQRLQEMPIDETKKKRLLQAYMRDYERTRKKGSGG